MSNPDVQAQNLNPRDIGRTGLWVWFSPEDIVRIRETDDFSVIWGILMECLTEARSRAEHPSSTDADYFAREYLDDLNLPARCSTCGAAGHDASDHSGPR